MYRTYENPYALELSIKIAERLLKANPDDIDLANELNDLQQRANFAWQDNEAKCDGYGY